MKGPARGTMEGFAISGALTSAESTMTLCSETSERFPCRQELTCHESSPEIPPPLPCNGHVEFCSRPYNRLVFPGTHNSYANLSKGFWEATANQNRDLPRQLEDGIRVFLLDAYPDGGRVRLCHSLCWLGHLDHRDALDQIQAFLLTHPREVLTLIYEDHISPSRIEGDFLSAGLVDYVYTHAPGTPWPTLGRMIESGQRLVVFGENGHPPPLWYHHLWDLAWDNPYRNNRFSDFRCELGRGKPGNDLFLFNHWLNTRLLNFPSEEKAMWVNDMEVLYPRVMDCIAKANRLPNFIAVNFYEHGDLLKVVDLLNGVNEDYETSLLAMQSLKQGVNVILFEGRILSLAEEPPPFTPLLGLASQ